MPLQSSSSTCYRYFRNLFARSGLDRRGGAGYAGGVMWQANKVSIITMGILALGVLGVYWYLAPLDEKKANDAVVVGVCGILAVGATISYLQARRDMNRRD